MKRWIATIATIGAALGWQAAARGQAPRLANGAPVPGEMRQATAEGIEFAAPRGPVMVPWSQLSLGTRYRHQPGFREALPKILAGEAVEPSAVAPAPEPPPSPAEPAAPTTTPAATEPAKPEPVVARTFPENTFPTPAMTLIYALAFTDHPADVLVAGINLQEKGKLPENLAIWWPHRTPATSPEWLKNSREGPGNFPPVRWSGRRDGHELEIELIPIFQGSHKRMSARGLMTITARKGGALARYLLQTASIPAGPDTAPLKISTPFAPPVIALRITNGGRQLNAAVRVGDWDILPLQGAETNLNVEVFDEKNRSVEKARVKTDEATFKEKTEPWQHDLKRMKGGETYTVKVSINLGPLFGVAETQQSVQVVDLNF